MGVQFSYENQNQTSYLVATFPPTEQLIKYQLQMMTSNDVKGLLPSMKRQKNEDILIYYNITSKISLSQILVRRKLTRQEFLNLLEGAAFAWREVQEYQLEGDGICFQEDYIYVASDTCIPSFIYLPRCMSSNGLENLKAFIQGLIIKGVVETVSDNFIQELLNVMNASDFSLEKLEKCIERFREKKKQPQTVGKTETRAPQRAAETPAAPVKETKESTACQTPETPAQAPVREGKKKRKQARPEAAGKDEKGKKKFLLFQALVMVCVAALISFGAFIDAETGQIFVQNAGAAALVIAALEFVVYREIFVNGKKEKGKVGKAQKERKTKNKTSHRANMEIPGKKVSENQSVRAKETVQEQRPEEQPDASALSFTGTVPAPVPSVPDADSDECLTEDATDFWDPNQVSEAYLEYVENGVSTKIPFTKESILVGRLRGQVDFPVNNARVGKMHAEFIRKDGSFYVQDLNSKNGTYINDSRNRINSNVWYPLSDGDQIHLADSIFVIRC